jgi:hypothetical protein
MIQNPKLSIKSSLPDIEKLAEMSPAEIAAIPAWKIDLKCEADHAFLGDLSALLKKTCTGTPAAILTMRPPLSVSTRIGMRSAKAARIGSAGHAGGTAPKRRLPGNRHSASAMSFSPKAQRRISGRINALRAGITI